MSLGNRQINGILDDYRNLVLRWNRRINLISRRDTADRLDKLIHQCRNCWTSLADSDTAGLAGASRMESNAYLRHRRQP